MSSTHILINEKFRRIAYALLISQAIIPVQEVLASTHLGSDNLKNSLPELGGKGTQKGLENKAHISSNQLEAKTAGVAQSVARQDWNNMTSEQIKTQAEGWAKNKAKAELLDPVQQQARDFLGNFGKAQVNIAVDDRGSLKGSSGSLLTPWYDTESTLIFSQAGVRGQDDRTIGNVGAGVRFFEGDWMWGGNTFIDHDISRSHTRGGLGAEIWSPNVRFATNVYHPLSNWKDSKDFEDYLERPAKGFDVRAQGYLPSYPHLGASMVYEKYYGDEVALFGKDNLQKNPHALTVGLDYTPVPILTLKLSHKQGQDNKHDNKADLVLNYQLGTPIDKQLDPGEVAIARSLQGSRYDLVDRNYDIVLEYKEKAGLLEVDLAAVPALLLEGDKYLMQPLVKNKYGIVDVAWKGDALPLAIMPTSGALNPQGWQITLPQWQSSPDATNHYVLSIVLTDEKGRKKTSNSVDIFVGQQRHGLLGLLGSDTAPASGMPTDVIKLSVNLLDHHGNAVGDQLKPVWKIQDATTGADLPVVAAGTSCPVDAQNNSLPCIQTLKEWVDVRDGASYYVKELVSTLSGSFIVNADLGLYGTSNSQNISFTPSQNANAVASVQILDSAGIDLLSTNSPPQLGVTYTLKLMDANGTDITSSVPPDSVRWELDGKNTSGCAVTLDSFDTGIRGYHFTPRNNTQSNSGVACGDQGFGLKVTYGT